MSAGPRFLRLFALTALSSVCLTLASTSQESVNPPEKSHWSFQPLKRPQVPEAKGEAGTDIDRFILAALEAKGQRMSPEADRTTLIRRVSFDLTGLPPTPSEIDAFLGRIGSREALAIAVVKRGSQIPGPHQPEVGGQRGALHQHVSLE